MSRLCLELPVLQPRSDGGEDGRQRGAGPGGPHHRGQQGNIKLIVNYTRNRYGQALELSEN